jgi:hypothetical protein
MTRRTNGKNSVSSATDRYREADFPVQIFTDGECVGFHALIDLVKPMSSGLILEWMRRIGL